ncbi:hypothetical protein [Actinoplanes sp. DH11]|uniref:hypothetical protein n=1 Tax=Actinoplanes sp. DH11 TaxID=2857011 RepID=UPI001E311A70|nr:hypothetical protein [Actinoplanes sp. DH11]
MGSTTAATGIAATFVWLGMILAISFLEAPLKFRAPGVTLAVGLSIGRLVFRALNIAEAALAVVVIAAMTAGYPRSALILSGIAVAALITQLIAVRPRLHRRTAAVLRGDTIQRSHAHLAYVALELVKAPALLAAGVLLLAG